MREGRETIIRSGFQMKIDTSSESNNIMLDRIEELLPGEVFMPVRNQQKQISEEEKNEM